MTPQQIHLVQSTWLQMLPIQEVAARLFYERLFELDPSLQRLFHGDMRAQGQKLMHVIDTAVNGLSQFEQVRPMIQALGRRHASYGVRDEHYGIVGSALLWTLAKGLGEAFTPAVRDAWSAAYGALATTMLEAGRNELAQGEPAPAASPAASAQAATGQPGASRAHAVYLVVMLGLVAALGWGAHLLAGSEPNSHSAPPRVASAHVDAPRLLLHALLTPTINAEAMPLRWVDPRRAMRCGPHAFIQVNGVALEPGTPVPDTPFEVEWHSDACRPFGNYGPRFDGRIKFTVYREDGGFSAMIEPQDLRVVSASGKTTLIDPGVVAMPHAAADNLVVMAVRCDSWSAPCR